MIRNLAEAKTLAYAGLAEFIIGSSWLVEAMIDVGPTIAKLGFVAVGAAVGIDGARRVNKAVTSAHELGQIEGMDSANDDR